MHARGEAKRAALLTFRGARRNQRARPGDHRPLEQPNSPEQQREGHGSIRQRDCRVQGAGDKCRCRNSVPVADALADKKKAELIAAKYTDLTLIEDTSSGPTGGPFVILIAKFADEAAAKKYLATQSKTLRTARVLPREREAKSLLDISGPAKDFESRTKDLLAPHALTAAACEAGNGTP